MLPNTQAYLPPILCGSSDGAALCSAMHENRQCRSSRVERLVRQHLFLLAESITLRYVCLLPLPI
jgi:hypothetical protein